MSEKKRIALLSNITTDLIAGKLRRKYDIYIPEGFDAWIQDVINSTSEIYTKQVDTIIVLLDGTEARSWKTVQEGVDRLELWKQAVSLLTNNISATPIFISTIDIRENRIKTLSERKHRLELENDWYQFVQELIEGKDNVYLFDLEDIISEIGRKSFYSNKMWYMSSMPYSRDGLNVVSEEIDKLVSSTFEARKKIIALDLDNTLWGGVVGEDGADGIELSDHKEGQRYFDFQRQLLEMKNRGVVLAINSKNNADDAEPVINEHPAMLLRGDDFVDKKINWDNKAANIKNMENELNITEGGFVFIDDNPVEREIVKGECPEVYVPNFPTDTSELLEFGEQLWEDAFRPLRVLNEDLNKTQMYQSEAKRKQDLSESLSIDEYIAKLDIKVDIHRMRPEEIERVTQLCNKTNQFNVTTKRYTQSEIEHFSESAEHEIFVVKSSDKYGDSGLISVLILEEGDSDARIDTFLMSCRVMGRKLEDVIINEIADMCSSKGKTKLIGEYITTAKNAPVEELYDRQGFNVTERNEGHKLYEMDLIDYQIKDFANYKEISFEG